MTDYFGYDVHFVMNITDIDDKVCKPLYLYFGCHLAIASRIEKPFY